MNHAFLPARAVTYEVLVNSNMVPIPALDTGPQSPLNGKTVPYRFLGTMWENLFSSNQQLLLICTALLFMIM